MGAGELVEVNGGVGGDLWAGVVEATRDCTIQVTCDSGDVNHVKVVASHELNGHVFPDGIRVPVTIPRDRASLASGIARARTGLAGCNFGADERGSSKEDRGQSSDFVEHFEFSK